MQSKGCAARGGALDQDAAWTKVARKSVLSVSNDLFGGLEDPTVRIASGGSWPPAAKAAG